MFARVVTISAMGFLQLLRSRVYLNLLVAGCFLVGCALALDRLSGGESARVLVNLGLGFVALITAVLAISTSILSLRREIETQEIQWLWVRPISCTELVLGRFLTTVALVGTTQFLLGAVLALLSWMNGAEPWRVWLACCFASFEGAILAAIAIFFGVASSSTISALFATTLFVLGRLTGMLGALLEAHRFQGPLEGLMRGVYWFLPHLPAFDVSDWTQGNADFTASQAATSTLYGMAYAGAVLALAVQRMKTRDLV